MLFQELAQNMTEKRRRRQLFVFRLYIIATFIALSEALEHSSTCSEGLVEHPVLRSVTSDFFNNLDENGDGVLEPFEIRDFVEELEGTTVSSHGTADIDHKVEKMMSNLDADADAEVTLADLQRRFSRLGSLLTVSEAADWVVHAVSLPEEVGQAFRDNAVTGYDFPDLLKDDGAALVYDFGITRRSFRKRIMKAIEMKLMGLGDPPNQPIVVVEELGGTSIRVVWQEDMIEGDKAGGAQAEIPTHKCLIKRKEQISGDLNNFREFSVVYDGPLRVFVDRNLKKGSTYIYSVELWNIVGRSPPTLVTVTTSEGSPAPYQILSWLGIKSSSNTNIKSTKNVSSTSSSKSTQARLPGPSDSENVNVDSSVGFVKGSSGVHRNDREGDAKALTSGKEVNKDGDAGSSPGGFWWMLWLIISNIWTTLYWLLSFVQSLIMLLTIAANLLVVKAMCGEGGTSNAQTAMKPLLWCVSIVTAWATKCMQMLGLIPGSTSTSVPSTHIPGTPISSLINTAQSDAQHVNNRNTMYSSGAYNGIGSHVYMNGGGQYGHVYNANTNGYVNGVSNGAGVSSQHMSPDRSNHNRHVVHRIMSSPEVRERENNWTRQAAGNGYQQQPGPYLGPPRVGGTSGATLGSYTSSQLDQSDGAVEAVDHCFSCKRTFRFFKRRRHNCGSCHRVFCSKHGYTNHNGYSNCAKCVCDECLAKATMRGEQRPRLSSFRRNSSSFMSRRRSSPVLDLTTGTSSFSL